MSLMLCTLSLMLWNFFIYRCTDEQGFRNENSCPSLHPTIKGRDLQKYLRNVSFDGLTGKVRFDRVWTSFLCFIQHHKHSTFTSHRNTSQKGHTMGTWNNDSTPKLKINTSNLRWKTLSTSVSSSSTELHPKEITSPCCWDCVKCPQGTISAEFGSNSCKACEPETKPSNDGTRCEKLPMINIIPTIPAGMITKVVASRGIILTMLACASIASFITAQS